MHRIKCEYTVDGIERVYQTQSATKVSDKDLRIMIQLNHKGQNIELKNIMRTYQP